MRRLAPVEYRCKDCTHFALGRACKSRHWITTICKMKPKGDDGRYYGCSRYGKPCEHFKLKEAGL